MNFLNMNKEYIGVHGQRIEIQSDSDGPYGDIQYINHPKELVLEMDGAIERFSGYIDNPDLHSGPCILFRYLEEDVPGGL